MAFLKIELKQIQSSQLVILERLDSIQLQLGDQPRVYDKNISINKLNECSLPIDNITDLQTFEDKIAGDSEFRTCLVKELTYIGGKHTKAMVRRIMAKLCTDELLQHYSYNGKKGKIPFCSLSICSGKFKNVCQDEIEETIKYVLVQAPFTIKRLLQKTSTKSNK
ncbi:unnamed protein product [Macrosiphum euphorbiae]|uniref:DUF4806 domain-containing protein n=1 Tax=Macrosiphum euphorbiae TaxID=13131 RepID=A0AAV0XC24_9HEMI|nr:unnamed protein product [Macrosiphum euphorbiae]